MQLSRNLTVIEKNKSFKATTVDTSAWTVEEWKEAALHFARTARELTFLWYGVKPTSTRDLTTCVILAQFDLDTPFLIDELPHIEECLDDRDQIAQETQTLPEEAQLDATFIDATNRHRQHRHRIDVPALIDTIQLSA